MLMKQKILNLALALTKASDRVLLRDGPLLRDQGLSIDQQEKIKQIGRLVQALCHGYSYVQSPAFDLEVASKSPSVAAMKRKVESVAERKN